MSDPLFDPDRQEACSLPSTAAVPFRFISDCQILPAPAPIFDCPDIDIPPDPPPYRPSTALIMSYYNETTLTGEPGAPGADCELPTGCMMWVWCECGSDSLSSLSSAGSAASAGSVASAGSAPSSSSAGEECKTEDTCENPPGAWYNCETGEIGLADEPLVPCWAGRMYGETAMICECALAGAGGGDGSSDSSGSSVSV